ncbi:hypothetical protein BsWGS_07181 [Bradybaena similaris]
MSRCCTHGWQQAFSPSTSLALPNKHGVSLRTQCDNYHWHNILAYRFAKMSPSDFNASAIGGPVAGIDGCRWQELHENSWLRAIITVVSVRKIFHYTAVANLSH